MAAPWSDPLPLEGVPDGCVARTRLVADGAGGWRLPRDRSGRTRLDEITVSAARPPASASQMADDPALRRFVLAAARRRWPTIAQRLGGRALVLAVALCQAGDVELVYRLDHPTRLGLPVAWRRAARHDPTATALAHRPADAAEEARRLLAAHAGQPWLDRWLEDARRSGLLRRASNDGADLVARAARIVAALPALTGGPPVGVTELAARHGGPRGAHALDAGHRLTALVLRAAASLLDAPYPRTAADRRALWAEVGVVPDRVSATVLVANLRPSGHHLAARQLRDRADAGLPTHLCAVDLATGPLTPDAPIDVYVCENPRVLEAALASQTTATLICTQGNPTTTALDLLTTLATTGCRLHYRGDFDWPGIAIANRVMAATGARPWRFDQATYRAAVDHHGIGNLVPLTGQPVIPTWDPPLGDAMAAAGVAVHEELQLEDAVATLPHSSEHASATPAVLPIGGRVKR
jgi:uncharacterized protein (TIGR02679 family)